MENKSLQLWHDSAEDALEADILAAGGPKAVAIMLWPSMKDDPNEAGKKVRRILNKEHSQKFSEEEKAMIVEAAAKSGSRCYASYICRLAQAKLQIVAPEDLKADILGRFEQAKRSLELILKEMGSIK